MAPGALPDFGGFINKGMDSKSVCAMVMVINGLLTFHTERERKKNEDIANKFFGKNRRASAPGSTNNRKRGTAVPSLASRIGGGKPYASNSSQHSGAVTKTTARPTKPIAKPAAGNVDAEWTHDLHALNNPSATRVSQVPPRAPRATQARNDRLAKAFNGSASSPNLNGQYNIVPKSKAPTSLTIKGLAGPYIIMAENFLRGTSAQDIETAMTPVGGPILSCRIVSEYPIVTAEIIFESKDGADNVKDTFNGQEADGRPLNVYYKEEAAAPKAAPRSAPTAPARQSIPSGPRAGRLDRDVGSDRYAPKDRAPSNGRNGRDDVIDGTYGFDDQMDVDNRDDNRNNNNNGRGLYSDNLVGNRNSQNNNYRGGNSRGGNPRGGDRWIGGGRNGSDRYR
ncbi:pentatricopeptide repeat protein [Rutstroemia sp. NJR-2017a BBW]|nr:pentatricopeptide repeat protein [Rutstroemia sp. NJR-2017a BBW]